MDRFHREVKHHDTPTARVCEFCRTADPNFGLRPDLDRLVHGPDSAAHHLTENGHVHHRVLEVSLRIQTGRSKHVHPAA
jgi:hypothetical protein